MKACITLFLLIATAIPVFSQDIHFCLSYTVLGEPIRVSNSWNVNEEGGYLYILYNQQQAMEGSVYELEVSEELNGQFTEVSRHRIATEIGKNWIAVYYRFYRGGDFKALIYKNGEPVACGYLTITQKKAKGRKFRQDPRLLYSNTKVIACRTVKEGKPVNPSAVFNISEGTSQITFLISNDKSLNTDQLNIDLYKKQSPFGEYSEFVESKRVKLERHRDITFFTLEFIEPGDYKVYIYDEDQVWINSGYVTINQ